MKEIKNIEEIKLMLAELLKQFDKELNEYQTDVYMYIKEDGTAELDTFVNVGGNSWLDDDHYTLYSDKQHYDTIYDSFQTNEELLEAAGITAEDVPHDPDYDLEWYEIRDYIKQNDELEKRVQEAYEECLPDDYEYEENAGTIIRLFIENQEETERMYTEMQG